MIKIYRLTTPARNSSIVLRGKTNNLMRYNFGGGDPMTGKPATIVLRSKYAQDLLEESDIFAQGLVKIERVGEGGEDVKEEAREPMKIEDVTSPEQLIEFVANTMGKMYQRPEAALDFAKKRGYDFPNLTIKKNEEK